MSSASPTHSADVIAPRASSAPAPLSFAQELLWLMDRAAPGLAAWNVPRALRLRGPLDVGALQSALDELVARHESLRTVFAAADGEPRQIVRPAEPVVMERADLRAEKDPQASAARVARDHALSPFDLATDPLLRVLLIQVATDEHVLCLNTHHIVSDGWSKSIMFRELSALYRAARTGGDAGLAPLPIQFSDYAAWERDARHEASLAEPLAYWREQLAGPLPVLDIPGDYRADVVPTFEGARRVAVLPVPLVARMRELAREHDATPYMMLLATYVAMLHRYSGQDDIVVGSPTVGRLQSETEDLIGYFANTLVLRTKLDGDPTFAELIGRVRDTAFGAYENQDVPFEKIVLELQRGRTLSHAPLFQAVLTMEDTVPGALELDGVTVEAIPVAEGATKFDLTMLVAEQTDGLRLALWYRTDRFAAATIDRMLAAFRDLLEAMVANPAQRVSDARIVGTSARTELLALGTGTSPASAMTVLELFDAVARRQPNTVAARCGDVTVTYGGLADQARGIASRLSVSGVRAGDTVAVLLERSTDVLAAVLGCWYAGAAYLPIASDTPAARVAAYIDGASATAAITSHDLLARLPASCTVVGVDDSNAPTSAIASSGSDLHVDPRAPAYILFTSGSTGTPKGVCVTHGNIAHYVSAITTRLEVADSDAWTFASVSPLGADLGNTSIFPALATGGVIDLVPDDVARDPVRFPGYIASHGVDVLKITPGHLQALLAGVAAEEPASVLPARWLVLGGEALGWDLAQRLVSAQKCRVLNHYGPTEATVGACTFEVTADAITSLRRDVATVPVGRPLPGTTCYVLDARRRLVPRGVVGELHIGGRGVAEGYVAQPALTAERFVEDPFSSAVAARMYATGDRVRWLGTTDALEFLGRADDQIKIRGFRVELPEIEHALASHPAVAGCAVVARAGATGGSSDQLVAFVVPQRATGYAAAHAAARNDADVDTVGAWVRERLPEYMVPDRIVMCESLPLGANGKVDRRALAALELDAESERETFVEPHGETEQGIAQIWQEVLQRERIGASESFLELGGHSLLAIRVLGKLSKRFGVRLPLRTLFDAPTIRALGTVVDAELREIERRELEAVLATIDAADIAGGAPAQQRQTEPGTT